MLKSLLIVLTSVTLTGAARILMLSPQFRSLVMMHASIGEELVQRGHEVYIVVGSRYPNPDLLEQLGLKTIKYHVPEDVLYASGKSQEEFIARYIFDPPNEEIDEWRLWYELLNQDCQFMFDDSELVDYLRKLNFDMATVDVTPFNLCHMLIPYILNVSFVSWVTYLPAWIVRLPALPSFHAVVGAGSTARSETPTFWNTLAETWEYVPWYRTVIPEWWNTTFIDYYSRRTLTWNDLLLQSELFLLDMDYPLRQRSALPLFPNFITASGMTVKPTKPLSGELGTVFNNSKHGVILVAFGTTANYLPASIVDKFFVAFARLKQNVVGKFTVPEGMKIPKNVYVLPWLPQNDMLGHPKTKLFISHCGSNGQHEALYHGVPMLGFPLFVDQPANCHHAFSKGFGLQMDIHNFTATELFETIQELLNNRTYGDMIKRSSAIWRDEPMIGRQKAAHWIEHVIKFGGDHLRSPAMELSMARFLMLDVLAVIFVTSVFLPAIIIACSICLLKLCLRTKAQQVIVGKKNQ